MVIVAAVDRSKRSDDIIEEAETLAKAFDETVHVVHVLPTSEFVKRGRTSAEAEEAVEMKEVRDVATDIAAEAATNLDIQSEVIGLVGDPASKIVNYAGHEGARYIVVAGRERSPTGKAIFGSVAQSILLNADCIRL